MKHAFAAAVLGLGLGLPYAWADKGLIVEPRSDIAGSHRVALVIGNAAYENIDRLDNPLGDAAAIAAKLTGLGFRVFTGKNMNRSEMTSFLRDFFDRIDSRSDILVYYSGHGVEVNGANYLIPVDFPKPAASSDIGMTRLLEDDAVSMSRILLDLQERKARVSILILDACRENPLRTSGSKSIGATRGLAMVHPETQDQSMFVFYSAGANKLAFDKLDRLPGGDPDPNGVFTRFLLKAMDTPGLEIRTLYEQVRENVREATSKFASQIQSPTAYVDMTERFFFVPGQEPKPVPAPEPKVSEDPARPRPDPCMTEWNFIKDTKSKAVVERFISKHKNSVCAEYANLLLDDLVRSQPAPAPPQPEPTPTVAGNWFVVMGSYPHGDRAKADSQMSYLKNVGIVASLIDTDDYPGLTDGLFSVVLGPFQKSVAANTLVSVKGYVPDAYIKAGF